MKKSKAPIWNFRRKVKLEGAMRMVEDGYLDKIEKDIKERYGLSLGWLRQNWFAITEYWKAVDKFERRIMMQRRKRR